MKVKHGWVLQYEDWFIAEDDGLETLDQAKVFTSRHLARTDSLKAPEEVVRKVEIDDDGEAVRVIKGR